MLRQAYHFWLPSQEIFLVNLYMGDAIALMRKTDFFIVGAPKCGTTAMYTYLRQHPKIFMPSRKEPHLFGSDLDFRGRVRITGQEYQALFTRARPDQKLGEASVFYLFSRRAAKEIFKYNSNARIVIMLRNPVEMLYSYHSQRMYTGTEDIKDFGEALDAEADRKRGVRIPGRVGLIQGLYYHELADFPLQIERYLAVFDRDQVHVILYDDLRRDTGAAYQDLCAFLGVQPPEDVNFRAINRNKVVRSRWFSRMLRSPPDGVGKLARTLIPSRRVRGKLFDVGRRLNTTYQQRGSLDPRIRKRLVKDFAPSITILGDMLDRDLSHWLQS